MPERYGRSVCANELLLMNTIIQRVANGWEMAPAFHLPTTVHGNERIGKEPTEGDTDMEAGPMRTSLSDTVVCDVTHEGGAQASLTAPTDESSQATPQSAQNDQNDGEQIPE